MHLYYKNFNPSLVFSSIEGNEDRTNTLKISLIKVKYISTKNVEQEKYGQHIPDCRFRKIKKKKKICIRYDST